MEIKNLECRIQNWVYSFLIFNSAFIILSSCSFKKVNPPPPNLIDESKMALVISDVTIAEAALNNEPLASFNDTLKKLNVLKEHNVSSQQFLLSMKYYAENPQKLKDIYAEAAKILDKKQPQGDTALKK